MRVMQIMSGAEVGGAETFFVDLLSSLQRARLEQYAIIRHQPARAAALREAGIKVLELPFRRFLDGGTKRAIARAIEDFRPDIVQSWMSRASALCPSPRQVKHPFLSIGWFGGYYDLKYFRHCDALVAVTKHLTEHIAQGGWPGERTQYLPTFSVSAPSPALPRASFDTPENAPLILALGRLHLVKGFDVLLKALARIPEAWLWLAGDGPLRRDLRKQAEALGVASRVRFLGWRNDRAALFAACDLCVMPSRDEPFGTVMIEAWAYRRPVIAAAALGPKALIQNERNGLLTPIDDVEALAAAIRRVTREPGLAKRLVENAWSDYQERYTEEKVTRLYLDFYQEMLARHA